MDAYFSNIIPVKRIVASAVDGCSISLSSCQWNKNIQSSRDNISPTSGKRLRDIFVYDSAASKFFYGR